ncbi:MULTISPECIES: hypothetical protein [unclassified Bacillus cereus group]|uniref:hypothetical protein n=1 Tax=unclassified Bacillus cereus group TaxID=2750818 RepID=UPI001F57E65B|nr:MULTISPECIES: hypothetical protein [unclassified Bacillus cereus group]MDX5808732.1 hypothetical protein [Bacillus cereus group sp. BfR-BA-02730]
MKKSSNMGSSKYEYNPEKFEKDVLNNEERYHGKSQEIKEELSILLKNEPSRMNETFSMMLQSLRELKEEYHL